MLYPELTALLLNAIVDICEDTALDRKSRKLQLGGVHTISKLAYEYAGDCVMLKIVLDIVKKKLEYLRTATTHKEVTEILTPPKPRYNGSELVVDSKYHIPAEEMLIWSRTSYLAPLSEEGYKRYMKVFREYFGEEIYQSLGFPD